MLMPQGICVCRCHAICKLAGLGCLDKHSDADEETLTVNDEDEHDSCCCPAGHTSSADSTAHSNSQAPDSLPFSHGPGCPANGMVPLAHRPGQSVQSSGSM